MSNCLVSRLKRAEHGLAVLRHDLSRSQRQHDLAVRDAEWFAQQSEWAEHGLAVLRHDLSRSQRQHDLAVRDAEWFAQQSEWAARVMKAIESAVGGMWLALLNSGLSHRRVLRIVMEVERGQ